MSMAGNVEHLTDRQFELYGRRELPAAELLLVGDHLAVCANCRDRLGGGLRVSGRIGDLQAEFLPANSHLSYEQLLDWTEGQANPETREHLALCRSCRADAEDLSKFKTELKKAREPRLLTRAARAPFWLAVAAVLVLAVSVSLLRTPPPQPRVAALVSLRDGQGSIELMPGGEIRSAQPIPAQYGTLVADVLRSGKLELGARATSLERKRGVLMGPGGSEQGSGFEPLGPVATAVLDDRPRFRWRVPAGASGFQVSVFDGDYRKVAESPLLGAIEWRPEKPLERGKTYSWQVTAKLAGRALRFPEPPAPEAVFLVLSAQDAGEVEALRAQGGGHLLLAAAYARYGLRDLARTEVAALAAQNPSSTLPRQLLESLNR